MICGPYAILHRNLEACLKTAVLLTVQLRRDIIDDTLFRVRVLNRWIIIRYEVALKILKHANLFNL
jgi:hypothetical protein